MAIQAGDRMPEGNFGLMTAEGPGAVSSGDLFSGKKVVLFSVPGAFTPACSSTHLPGFIKQAGAIKAKGVNTIACIAVNDVFVMNAWGKDQGAGDKVMMLADGNAVYTKALGLELDASGFGMGIRGQRFAIVVEDGVATQVHCEAAPSEVKESSAENILSNL
jgi:glutaredoxin/glutathione-dependent peroxiredoxin